MKYTQADLERAEAWDLANECNFGEHSLGLIAQLIADVREECAAACEPEHPETCNKLYLAGRRDAALVIRGEL